MDDLISRQAAIDALGEKPLAWTDGEYELALQQQWESDVDAIKAVPSAQPEIIRCKGCKFFVSDMEWCEADDEHPASPDAFCSWAERRSDE